MKHEIVAGAPGVESSLFPSAWGAAPHLMSSQARRYCDLVLELKAVRSMDGGETRERELEAEILDLWRELSVDERMAVERALIQ